MFRLWPGRRRCGVALLSAHLSLPPGGNVLKARKGEKKEKEPRLQDNEYKTARWNV